MESFPEQRTQVSIHHNGSFESLSSVLANTNLNDLTAVFYWFTPDCDEPFFCLLFRDACVGLVCDEADLCEYTHL